jgi:hypothetical protein
LRALLSSPGGLAVAGEAATAVVANSVPDLVESWRRLAVRDLRIEKIAQSESVGEPPESVYVVTASAADSARLVLEIQIRHE